MTLSLDHIQRLNLITLLDAIECSGRREAWATCKLQETLDLNPQEREQIGLRKETTIDGRDGYRWDLSKSLEPRQYTVNQEDLDRIGRALDLVPVWVLGRERWFKALQAQLPEPVESNGAQRTATVSES